MRLAAQFISNRGHGIFPAPTMDSLWAWDGCLMGILLSPHCQRLSRCPACLTACSPLSQAAVGPAFSPLVVISVSLRTHGCLMGGLLSNDWVPKCLSTEHGLRWERAWDCRADWYCWRGRFGEEGQKSTLELKEKMLYTQEFIREPLHRAHQAAPALFCFTSCPCGDSVSASQHLRITHFQSPGRPFKVTQYFSVFSSIKLP